MDIERASPRGPFFRVGKWKSLRHIHLGGRVTSLALPHLHFFSNYGVRYVKIRIMWILVNVECESCGGQASIALLEEAPDLSDRREIEGCIHSKVYETQIDPNSIAYVHPNQ